MTCQNKRKVKLSEIIIPKYQVIFHDREHKHIILTSGRAGTKSSFAGVRGIYQIVSDPSGSVVVLRKRHNKLRKTVYKEMLRGINVTRHFIVDEKSILFSTVSTPLRHLHFADRTLLSTKLCSQIKIFRLELCVQ